jgi:BirA family biotin operon repressor/biotin-[acetyl-CoA-carboxylase] ligase
VRLRGSDPAAPTLALTAAVALHEAASAFAPDAGLTLKWPNDLLAGSAKMAGVLLEREGEAVIAGFGVNLACYPESLDRPATSLAALTGFAPDVMEFADELTAAFGRWLGRWRSEGVGPVRAAWLAAAHPVGTPLVTSEVEGIFDGLDESGGLRLRLADGSRRVIHAGDVFLI